MVDAVQHSAAEGDVMLESWYAVMMLAIESNGVICLRLMKLACGGSEAQDEVHLMVGEKIEAAFEASASLMAGGTLVSVVDRYREHVAANSTRLLPA